MSGHVWESTRLTSDVAYGGLVAIRVAIKSGAGYEAALRFCGYYLERRRQDGGKGPATLWRGATQSKHRYAKGKNKDNYLKAGELVLRHYAEQCGLPDAPPQAVWDWLDENPEKLVDWVVAESEHPFRLIDPLGLDYVETDGP